MSKNRLIGTLILAALATKPQAAFATPLSYTGGTVSQDFNGLPTNVTNPVQTITGRGPHEFSAVTGASGLDGWQFANPSGTSSSTEFRSHDGSQAGNTGRGSISFGTNGSTDRALGALATSNQIPVFGLVLVNNSLVTYDSVSLAYTGEQWRRGNVASPNKLFFAYAVGGASISSGTFTGVAALDVTAPNAQAAPTEVALNGNLATNQVSLSATLTNLNWAPGQQLVLRWTAQDQSGQDDGIGIDNLSFAAHPVPEPASMALAMSGAVALVGLALRRRLRVQA
ncbi:MAG: PEP-CTERM sorting domain-containing protein [Pirellulales bacterium]|nr:PEP-CTERM sorting domain-containing protein [Pirellulales bacterium]